MPTVKDQPLTRSEITREKTAPAGIGDLLLRLIGGDHHGRIIRIHAAKCTVGSAPGCTLRLKAPGVEPVHALIMRGPQGAIIRRYGERLEINEAEIDDASLQAGDRLRIGPVQLMVLGANATQDDVQLAASPAATKMQKAWKEQVRKTRRAGHQRLKRILGTLRQQRQQIGELANAADRRKLEFERLAQQLSSLQRELTHERELQLSGDQQQRSALLQVDQLTHSLERLRQDFLAAQTRHRQESDHWRLDQSRLTEDIVERDRKLHLLQGELAQRQWDLDQLQAQLKRALRQADLEREQNEVNRERLKQEADAKQAENVSLNDEVAKQERAVAHAKQEAVAKQREFDLLKQQFEKAQRELTAERARLATELQGLQAGGSQWEHERQELRNDVSTQQSHIENLESQLDQQTTIAGDLRRELEKCRDALAQLRSQYTTAQQAWELDRLKIIAQVSDAAAQDAKLVAGKQTVIEELHAKLVGLEGQLAKREDALEQATEDLDQLRKSSQSNQAAWEWERVRLTQLIAERDRQLEEAKDWEERLHIKTLELQTEQVERTRLEHDLVQQKEEYDRQCKEIRDLRTSQQRHDVQLTIDESELKSISRTCAELKSELAQHSSAEEALNTEVARLREQCDEAQRDLAAAQKDLEATRQELQTAQTNLATANREVESTRGEFEGTRQELQTLQSSLTTAEQKAESAHGDLETARQELQASQAEAQEAKAAQLNLQAEIERLTAELQQANDPPPMQTLVIAPREESAEDIASRQELEAREAKLAGELEAMQARQRELDEQSQSQSERETELTRLQEELQARSAEIETQRTSLQTAAEHLGQAEQQLASEREALATAQAEFEERTKQAAASVVAETSPAEGEGPGYQPTNTWGTFQLQSTFEQAQEDLEKLRGELDRQTLAESVFVAEPQASEVAGIDQFMTEAAATPSEETPLAPVAEAVEQIPVTPNAPEDWSAAEAELRAIMAEEFHDEPAGASALQVEAVAEAPVAEPQPEAVAEPTPEPEIQESIQSSNSDEDGFLMPSVWSEQPQEPSAAIEEPVATASVDQPAEIVAPVQFNDIADNDPASPFPDFTADDLASALGGPSAAPANDPSTPKPLTGNPPGSMTEFGVTPEQLPEWKYEHERPEKVDTITGLRIQNLLQEEFTEEHHSQPGPVLPLPPVEGSTSEERTAEEEEADIFARLRAAGIVKDDMSPTSQEEPVRESGSGIAPAVSEEALADALADQPPSGLSSSRFMPSTQDEPEAEEPPARSFSRPAPASESGEDEESIESYMQQLLTRVRGDGGSVSGTGPNPVYRAAATPAREPEAEKPAAPAKPVNTTPVTQEEYIPRSQAPEQSMSLAAMREVANSQARAAIHTHAKKVGKKKSSTRFAAAAAAMACGVGGLVLGTQIGSLPATVGGGIGLVIGIFWICQGLWLARAPIARAMILEQQWAKKDKEEEKDE